MKLKIEVKQNDVLHVFVPEHIDKCEVVNYGFAGTWLMECDSKELNAWKMKIPNGKYEVIGRTKDVIVIEDSDLTCIEVDKNFILRKIYY